MLGVEAQPRSTIPCLSLSKEKTIPCLNLSNGMGNNTLF